MRIAISAQQAGTNAQVDPRFGRARLFILHDTELDTWDTVDNQQRLDLPQGAGIQAAQIVIERGAQTLLTGHCGPNAYKTLQAGGVQVCVGASGTVAEAVRAFAAGELQVAAGADVKGHW